MNKAFCNSKVKTYTPATASVRREKKQRECADKRKKHLSFVQNFLEKNMKST